MTMRILGIAVSVAAATIAVTAAGSSETPAGDNEVGQRLIQMLKERDAAVRDLARSTEGPLSPADVKRMKAIVGEAFDYDELSRESLKKYWPERTPEERKEFADLYRRLIERSYANPKLYRKVEDIVYVGADVVGEQARVRTTVHYKGEESEIVYALHRAGGEWLITDMTIDDVSVVRNNRQNFYREIAKSSYAVLVSKIRKKLAEEPSGSDKTSAKVY